MPANPRVAEPRERIAPVWHTIILLIGLVGLALAVARSATLPFVGAYGKGAAYIWITLFEWVIVGFVYFGVSSYGIGLRELVGGKWTRPIAILRDAGISLAFLAIIFVVSQALGNLLQAEPNEAVRDLIPRSSSDSLSFPNSDPDGWLLRGSNLSRISAAPVLRLDPLCRRRNRASSSHLRCRT